MPRLKFSMEIPVNYVDEMARYEDQGFCIAPYVLMSERYAEGYRNRLNSGQRVLMDNGAYELGKSLEVGELLRAADLLGGPQEGLYLILPDVPTRMQESLDLTLFNRDVLWMENFNLVGVVQGATVEEQWESYRRLHDEELHMLALSFLWNRPLFLKEKWMYLNSNRPLHLLGCYEVREIEWMLGQGWDLQLSIDTVKPLKAAMIGKHIINYERGDVSVKWDPLIELDWQVKDMWKLNAEHMQALCNGLLTHDVVLDYTRPLSKKTDSRSI